MALNSINELIDSWSRQKIAISLNFYHEDMARRKRLGLTVKRQRELRRNGARLKACSGKSNKLNTKLKRVTPRGKAWMRAVELSGL
ncbi:hypothetical protein R7007_21725 [Vibrio sp. 1636]|uniref:hypothetical protein n=1 Tax=Vibrio TaxID=662 RepID=UPI001BAFE361|nr:MULTISPECIES: hypothetical protein [Vibrio]MDW2204292.1 hypothetical protein [Vibrio sp. 1636]